MKEEQTTRLWAVAVRMLLVIAVMASFVLASTAQAAQHDTEGRRVIPMGRTVGIKLFSDGVMVVGFSEVAAAGGSSAPARECGLREGDIITHINSAEVDTIEEVQSVLQQVGGEKMSIRASRDGKQLQVTAQAVQCSADGQYKLGAWIRDSMAGIGTMTYYDPGTGVFGALGHGINDVDTALLMPLQSGNIMYSEVTDVKKGESGAPGELHGAFQVDRDLGTLSANTAGGVFGTLTDKSLTAGHTAMEVASRQQVHTGKASILTNIAGDTVEEYGVEIMRVYPAAPGGVVYPLGKHSPGGTGARPGGHRQPGSRPGRRLERHPRLRQPQRAQTSGPGGLFRAQSTQDRDGQDAPGA